MQAGRIVKVQLPGHLVSAMDGFINGSADYSGRDEVLAGIGDGERNEVVGSLAQRGSQPGRYGAHKTLKVRVGDAGFAEGGVTDAVRSILHRDLRGDFLGVPQLDLCAAGHEFVF